MKKTYLNTLEPEEIIKRLKNGKEIKYENISLKTKMVDGVICDFDGNGEYIIGSPLKSEHGNFSYFEDDDEDKFEITETGFYKTRDGRKVVISYVDESAIGFIEEKGTITHWDLSGQWISGWTDGRDIVSKWED